MDDIYIFSQSKEILRDLKNKINTLLSESLKLNINIKKSYITKSTRGFVFMQQKYFTNNKKLIVTPVYKNLQEKE